MPDIKAKKLLFVPGAIVSAALLLFAFLQQELKQSDAEHARFYNLGRRINTFLSEYSQAVKTAFTEKNASRLAAFYADDYVTCGEARQDSNWKEPATAVTVSKLVAPPCKSYRRADALHEFSRYLGESVEGVKYKIGLIEEAGRSGARLTVWFLLNGVDHQGRLFQDRHLYRWHLVNESAVVGGFRWRIAQSELVEGVRVAGRGNSFLAADLEQIGIDYRHERDPKLSPEFDPESARKRLRFGVIQHAMGGVSTVDYDNDGRPDIFFADGRRSRLFRNEGRTENKLASFSDVTDEAGLSGIREANAGIFADIDNDGFKDLFVVRYLATNQLFHNNGDGTFADQSAETGLDLLAPSASATFLDFNLDGFVDLYVAVYGDAFEQVPRIPFFAQNGGRNRLYQNIQVSQEKRGHRVGRKFVDVTDASATGDPGWSLAVAAADYDRNGYPDLVVANDFGRKNLYRNNGDGSFSEVAKEAGVLDFSGGMSVTFGDIDNDGHLDLYTSNIQSNQRWFGEDLTLLQYMRNVVRTKWALLDAAEYWKMYKLLGEGWRELGKMVGEGNSLFRNKGGGTFEELKEAHVNRAGWAWGVAFLDVDNDADLDIYAANGWISNRPNTDL